MMDIKIELVKTRKEKPDMNNLGFGKYYTDHMFEMDYTDESSLIGWLLTFGEKAKVLEPAEVREKLLKTAESIASIYRKEDRG